jgi:hypothetical protein
VAGVLYLAPPVVERALKRAIEGESAQARIVVVALDVLLGSPEGAQRSPMRTIPGDP